jgi:hypothetical protein
VTADEGVLAYGDVSFTGSFKDGRHRLGEAGAVPAPENLHA